MVDFQKHISEFLLNSDFIGCLIIDRNSNILYANQVFNNLFRDIEGSVIGMNLIDILKEEEKESISIIIDAIFKHGELPKTELSIVNNHNETLHLDFEAKLIEEKGQEFGLGIIVDKTAERSLKEELQVSRRQLQNFTDQLPGVALQYFLKPNGTDGLLFLSKGVEDIYEVNRDEALKNVSLLWSQIQDEDFPEMRASIEESAKTLNNWESVHRIVTASGKTKYMSSVGTPRKKEDGTIVWDTLSMEITDGVEKRIELENKTLQLQSITNQIPGVVVRYQLFPDGSDKLIYISNGVKDLYGITKEEALENTDLIWDRYLEKDIPELRASIQKSAETMQPWEHIFRYYTLENEIGFLQGYGTPTRGEDGTIIWDAITMDITKRMEAELEANRSNSKLRSFIKSSPIAIYQIDPTGNVTDFWNPAAEQIYGWTKSEVLDRTLPHLSEENKKEFSEIIEDIRISKKPKQFQVKRKNRYNEQLTLEITAGPLFDEHGKLTDLLIIASDITELEEYRKTLESALREKEILLQEIHHRVKNNLAIVSGLLELQALKDDSNQDMSLIIEARNRIHSIAMVHEQLYQDMDFSHINPRDYYEKLLSKLQANTVAGEPNIEYDLKFDIDRININRAVPLGLLINELFTNSIKHAFKDGMGKLRLHFTQIEDQIRVYYEDDGPGFKMEEIKTKNTIGWQLIETLLLQLDSEYTMDTDGRFMLDFVFTEVMQGSQSHYR